MTEAGTPKAEVEDQSMEEILQSIRRIISEDDAADAKGAADPVKMEDAAEPDVLELTEIIAEEVAVPAEDSAEDVLGDIDAALASQENSFTETPEIQPSEEPEITVADDFPTFGDPHEVAASQPSPDSAASADAFDDLVSSQTAATTTALFHKIKHPEQPPLAASGVGFRSGTTLEDLVGEMMRPMLKEWLNANLPILVERVIEREVKKLSS